MNKKKKTGGMFGQIQFGIKIKLKKECFIVKEAFFPDEVDKSIMADYIVNKNFKRWFFYKEEHFEKEGNETIYARDVVNQEKCGSMVNELSRAIINLKEIDLLREMNLLSKTQTNRFLTTDQSMLVRIIDVDWIDAAWHLRAHSINTPWPIGIRAYMR